MSARDEILAGIRRATRDSPPAPEVPDVVREPRAGDIVDLFVERVEDYRAEVTRCDATGLAATIGRLLNRESARSVVLPSGFDGALLVQASATVVRDDPERPLEATRLDQIDAVVSAAAVAVSETGTIVLDHGPDQGRRALTLVPDVHVCVVCEPQVVADVPEAVAVLDRSVRQGRPLTWISGPSATSDIELQRVEGVHGPRRLHVVLVG